MKIGYYPGCSSAGTGKEYNISLEKVLKQLDVELEELNDWSCCGASSAHVTNHMLSIALPAVNLAIAEKQKQKELFAPCAACYNRLIVAKHEIESNPHVAKQISDILEQRLENNTEIINIIELFEKIGRDKIAGKRKIDLKGLKVACYYGCLLVRPFDITHFDDPEQPESMEKIISATGAEAVDWNFKVECCGAAHSIAHKEIVVDLSKKILDDAKLHGADVIVVACPMCHSNLDMRQLAVKNEFPGYEYIPVFYLSELIGLSLGIESKELGINLHYVPADKVLEKVSV